MICSEIVRVPFIIPLDSGIGCSTNLWPWAREQLPLASLEQEPPRSAQRADGGGLRVLEAKDFWDDSWIRLEIC